MPDIVIGARRPSHHRTLRGAAIAVALSAVTLLVGYFIYLRVVSYTEPSVDIPAERIVVTGIGRATGSGANRLTFGQSSLTYSGAIAVLRSSGTPRDIGGAHGRLLDERLGAPVDALAATIRHAIPAEGLFARLVHGMRLRWRYRLVEDGIPGHQLTEIATVLRGMQRWSGSTPDYETFVRQQAALDIGVAAPWSSGAAFRAVTRSLSFVSELRGPGGDRLFVGRSFALPGAGDGGDSAAAAITVSFVHADSVIPFASIGWPGLVGVVSGVNAEGIAVMVHPVRTSDIAVTRNAQPVTLMARDILENARTLNEAIAIAQHATPLGAAAFVIADGSARRWAVVERSPTRFAVARDMQPCAVTDILTADPFEDDADNDRARRIRPASMRRKRVRALLRRRAEAPGDYAAMLRDHRDAEGAPLPPGHRGAVYDASAVHAALFDVSGMVLWVADRADARARFRAFDLRHELRGEGVHPAPPADLAPAGQDHDSASLRVRRARNHLRQARQSWRDGDRERAGEQIARALTHAPSLPEALHLAGNLAADLGDHDRARHYYQLFMNTQPDDLNAAQKIRATLKIAAE
ncbi:MAG: C45 family autoproteolytic acyltransferase/hydrolase [Proteobacteria bacterium]|nr:C45 family autoproteolytic acyltransferase/hydrolase [Pseudomonadota bacterium]